jgi:hypothetical protein
MGRRYAYRGYVIERGDYIGTSDDQIDRWYVTDPESTTVDRRGNGYRTIRDAKQVINQRLLYWSRTVL